MTTSRSVSEEIGIDFRKLQTIIRKNIVWIILIFLFTNAAAYLVIRWTKPLYESESILRLDVKEDANILGLQNLPENNDNFMAGEIELIRSKLFLNRVIDNVGLDISYYLVGDVLNDEKFLSSSIYADILGAEPAILDRRIYVEIIDENSYRVAPDSESGLSDSPVYNYDQKVTLPGLEFRLYLTKFFDPALDFRTFFFMVNSRESNLKYLQDNLTVEPDKEYAKTIRIAFRDQNATKAKVLVNTIDSLYLTYTSLKENQENEQKIAWLNSELRKIENQLEDYENYIEQFTIENRTSDLNEDLRNTLVVMNELDSQRYEYSIRLRSTSNLIKDLGAESTVQVLDVNIGNYPDFIREEISALDELYRRRQRLELSYRESTMAIQRVDESIENARTALTQRLKAYEQRLQNELQVIDSRKAELEQQFTSLPGKSNEFNKNKRFYELYEEFYLSLLQSKAQFEIARAGTNTNFEILAPASVPDGPISPNKLLIHGIGAVSGIVLIFLFVGILYLTNNKINTVQELEQLTDSSFLGSVPKASMRTDISQLIVDQHPRSAVSESLRAIRTNIQFMTSGKKNNIISVTSTIAGEGKTFISVNLGGIIAVSGKRVLLLDLDMRKPRVHLSFGAENDDKGVSTILIGRYTAGDCIRKTNLEGLDYIAAGPTPPNPAELLMGDPFQHLLNELSEQYDTIILDTPPVGLVTDGILVMQKADISLYIIRSGYSKKHFTDTLNRLSKEENFRARIAVILNALPRLGQASYGYGYYQDSRTKVS